MGLRIFRSLLIALLIVVVTALAWEGLLRLLGTPTYTFPRPSEIMSSFAGQSADVWTAWLTTIKEALAGLVIAVIVSGFLAAGTFFLPSHVGRIINVAAVTLQSTPLLAIAPLLSLWFGAGLGSKVAASAVICFFPLLVGWLAGAKSIDEDYVDLFENMGANRLQQVRYLIIPSALPYFFGGLRVAAPLSILGAIVGEFVGASEGLGFRILSSSYYLRTADMFVYVIVTGLTGWVLSELAQSAERRLLFWRGKGRV